MPYAQAPIPSGRDGVTDLDEVLKEQLGTLKSDRDQATAALERAEESSASFIQIDPALIEASRPDRYPSERPTFSRLST